MKESAVKRANPDGGGAEQSEDSIIHIDTKNGTLPIRQYDYAQGYLVTIEKVIREGFFKDEELLEKACKHYISKVFHSEEGRNEVQPTAGRLHRHFCVWGTRRPFSKKLYDNIYKRFNCVLNVKEFKSADLRCVIKYCNKAPPREVVMVEYARHYKF